MMLRSRAKRRGVAELMLAGAATLTIDQRVGRVSDLSGDDALARDWVAVGNDLRKAMSQNGRARRVVRAA